jgi:glycosyltransferase involved in cell wall biosynthesis
MASQTPVVASNVGGLEFTVVPEVTGLLAPPKDEAAFADAIDRILINPIWRDELGAAGRKRVEIAFSWDSVASGLTDLYTHLLTQTRAKTEKQPQIAA